MLLFQPPEEQGFHESKLARDSGLDEVLGFFELFLIGTFESGHTIAFRGYL
jgi:hypothetical protein